MGAGEAERLTGRGAGKNDLQGFQRYNTVVQRNATTLPTIEEINFEDDNKPEPEEKSL